MKHEFDTKGKVYYQNLKAKYLLAAREAAMAGDRVSSEYNFQMAEHYSRVIAERFSCRQEPHKKEEPRQINVSDNAAEKCTSSEMQGTVPSEINSSAGPKVTRKIVTRRPNRSKRQQHTQKDELEKGPEFSD
jgi:hypothetical protein